MTRESGSISGKATRSVSLPEDFKKALAQNITARTAFKEFSYSHKKEWVDWINQAKKIETRARRIEKAIAVLLKGK